MADMNRRRSARIALAVIAVMMLPAGLQAAFAPRSFFDDFPLGRGWIAHDGDAFNEHLVRDVGALFLALITVTAWTVWRDGATRPVAAAWLVQGVLHFAYHVGHLDGYETVDKVGLVGSLVAVPALALVALWAGWSASPSDATRG
jgi:uncharacterized membrane protein